MIQTVREQIRSMLKVQPSADGFSATLTLSADFSVLTDHFAGQPLLPGMCMVQAVLIAAAEAMGVGELRLRALKNAKWMQPIAPGDQIFINGTITPSGNCDVAIKAKLTCSEKRCAEISLVAFTPSPGTPGEGWGEGSVAMGERSAVATEPSPSLSRSTGRGTDASASASTEEARQ